MTKTAEQMFKELGFEVRVKKETIINYKDKEQVDIIFLLSSKEYIVGNYDSINKYASVDFKLHKAITQQMKELGWFPKNNVDDFIKNLEENELLFKAWGEKFRLEEAIREKLEELETTLAEIKELVKEDE